MEWPTSESRYAQWYDQGIVLDCVQYKSIPSRNGDFLDCARRHFHEKTGLHGVLEVANGASRVFRARPG